MGTLGEGEGEGEGDDASAQLVRTRHRRTQQCPIDAVVVPVDLRDLLFEPFITAILGARRPSLGGVVRRRAIVAPCSDNTAHIDSTPQHRRFHGMAVRISGAVPGRGVLGVLWGTASFPTTAVGYRQLLAWVGGFGTLRRAGVECTGSYGAALSTYLLAAGWEVCEVNQPDKAGRRRRGNTDAIDAEAAARAVLSGRATALAKTSNGPVEMVGMFRLARASAIKSRTQAINQLKAVFVGADPLLRESLSGLSNTTLIRQCAQLPVEAPSDITTAAVYTLQLLARRILDLTTQINDLKQRITEVLTAHAPQLLDHYGVGPGTAAVLLMPRETTPNDCTVRPPSPPCAVSAPLRRLRARPIAVDSIGAGIDKQTQPYTPSS